MEKNIETALIFFEYFKEQALGALPPEVILFFSQYGTLIGLTTLYVLAEVYYAHQKGLELE